MLALIIRFIPYLAAAALFALGGWWIGHQGVYRERAVTAEHDAKCTADKRDVAQRFADAVSAQLEAAAGRAVAAEAASRAAADQLDQARRAAASRIREIRNAQSVPVACVPDDLRLRINEAVRAINADDDPGAAQPAIVPDAVPGTAGTGLRPPKLGS